MACIGAQQYQPADDWIATGSWFCVGREGDAGRKSEMCCVMPCHDSARRLVSGAAWVYTSCILWGGLCISTTLFMQRIPAYSMTKWSPAVASVLPSAGFAWHLGRATSTPETYQKGSVASASVLMWARVMAPCWHVLLIMLAARAVPAAELPACSPDLSCYMQPALQSASTTSLCLHCASQGAHGLGNLGGCAVLSWLTIACTARPCATLIAACSSITCPGCRRRDWRPVRVCVCARAPRSAERRRHCALRCGHLLP